MPVFRAWGVHGWVEDGGNNSYKQSCRQPDSASSMDGTKEYTVVVRLGFIVIAIDLILMCLHSGILSPRFLHYEKVCILGCVRVRAWAWACLFGRYLLIDARKEGGGDGWGYLYDNKERRLAGGRGMDLW